MGSRRGGRGTVFCEAELRAGLTSAAGLTCGVLDWPCPDAITVRRAAAQDVSRKPTRTATGGSRLHTILRFHGVQSDSQRLIGTDVTAAHPRGVRQLGRVASVAPAALGASGFMGGSSARSVCGSAPYALQSMRASSAGRARTQPRRSARRACAGFENRPMASSSLRDRQDSHMTTQNPQRLQQSRPPKRHPLADLADPLGAGC